MVNSTVPVKVNFTIPKEYKNGNYFIMLLNWSSYALRALGLGFLRCAGKSGINDLRELPVRSSQGSI